MSTLKRLFDAITNPAINKTWIAPLEPDGGAPWKEFTEALGEAESQLKASPSSDAMREACDRTEIIINRALNCNWLTVNDHEQFKATLRIALDTEVAAGGPYLDNGWNRSAPVPSSDGIFCHNEGATFCSTCGLAKLGRVVPDKSPPPDDVRNTLADILKHAQAPKREASERLDNIEALAKKGLDALRSAPIRALIPPAPVLARDAVKELSAAVNKIREEAFLIPAPNPHTPEIVLWCTWLDKAIRYLASGAKS